MSDQENSLPKNLQIQKEGIISSRELANWIKFWLQSQGRARRQAAPGSHYLPEGHWCDRRAHPGPVRLFALWEGRRGGREPGKLPGCLVRFAGWGFGRRKGRGRGRARVPAVRASHAVRLCSPPGRSPAGAVGVWTRAGVAFAWCGSLW